MKKTHLMLSKEQYIIMGISAFLYILMVTKMFFTISIDSKALIDLIIISTPHKVQQAIDLLPPIIVRPHYIQLFVDSLFVSMFYPLLISLFASSFLSIAVISISGLSDIIENGVVFYFLVKRTPDAFVLHIASIATNMKFLFLALSVVIIIVKLLRKTS